MQNKEVINAFHKDYVKTYEPDLMKEFRTHAANREDREEKNLKTGHKPLKTLTRSTMLKLDKAASKKALLKPKEFHVYQKAQGAKK